MKALLLIFLLTYTSLAAANDSYEFKAESLIRENRLEEAKTWISENKIKESSKSKLLGRISMLEGESLNALKHFNKYLRLVKKPEAKVLMMSAQISLKNKKPSQAKRFLERIKKASVQKDLLYAQSIWAEGQKSRAVDYLSEAKKNRYESYDLIERQKYYFLYELGLISKLFKSSLSYLKNKKSSVEAGLYVVSLLKAKDMHLAESYFDQLMMLKPGNALVLRERGVFELGKKRLYLASLFFSKAAHLNNKYSFEAASAHLSLGHHAQAQFFNTKVKDSKKRVQQLFTIYLDSEDYEKALSLKYELEKLNLLKDDKVSYALMYTAFKARDYGTFNRLFSRVTSRVYLSKVLKLKEIVESCKNNLELACVFS